MKPYSRQFKRTILIFLILTIGAHVTQIFAQEAIVKDGSYHKKMKWFKDAKLGIFIHWGIYAVNGIDESWSFYNEYLAHEDYLRQIEGFTAAKYEPDYWASLIKKSGARYAVLTAKHHDGFALWDSDFGDLNVTKSPAKHDLIEPFVTALGKKKLKVGLYYSLPDWSYEDYPNFTRNKKRYENDSVRWNNFLNYYHGQLKELNRRYRPDLWWFDGDWEFGDVKWKAAEVRGFLLEENPEAILNSRLRQYGDYATPEQGVPIVRPKKDYWELCMTMNNSWGYQGNDKAYKTPNQIIRIFVDCISMGGNLLLDIGPKADGTIPDEQIHILSELGRWTGKHQEAIFGTRRGLPPGHFNGPTTISSDGQVLYLFLTQKAIHPIVIKGLKNQINRIRIVGDGTKLSHQVVGKMYWSEVPGLLYIDVPEEKQDPEVTVIAIQLKGKIDLYREDGQVIESN
ncbi:MAG: alpha-L-fucosidase [Cytophagales bacterium]|nr:alpha-L-fucosidase [Cytophagales bacterium]